MAWHDIPRESSRSGVGLCISFDLVRDTHIHNYPGRGVGEILQQDALAGELLAIGCSEGAFLRRMETTPE
jgi:hypothetical protein